MLLSISTLLIGLLLLVKGAEILISCAIAIGKKLKVSEFFIGLIVVGFGTSLCELVVSIDAVIKGSPDISVGNVIGSNIANIFLVTFAAGLTSELKSIKVSKFDLFFHLGAHLIFALIFILAFLSTKYGLFFIFLFTFYLFRSFKNSDSKSKDEIVLEKDFFSKISFKNPFLYGLPVAGGSIGITLFGADITVDSAISISTILNISDSFIGLTIIALGTSLPEIATSITAARKGKSNIIVGNIIGSNIYNLLLILGFTSLFNSFSYNKDVLLDDVYFLSIAAIIFTLFIFKRIGIGRKVSITCFLIYLMYIGNLYLTNF